MTDKPEPVKPGKPGKPGKTGTPEKPDYNNPFAAMPRGDYAEQDPQTPELAGFCEYPKCYGWEDLRIVPGETAYLWDGEGENPNRDRRYCRRHAKAYQDYWHALWQEHYFKKPAKLKIDLAFEKAKT